MSSLETAILKPETTPFLVFGYGSLIYKPPPHVARRIPGYITSHIRRFWQLSEDHRGTPTHPGRVVTLLTHDDYQHFNTVSADANQTELIESKDLIDSSKGEKCWGVVYEIVPESVEEVKAYLSIREINGYSLTTVKMSRLYMTELFKPECLSAHLTIPNFHPSQIPIKVSWKQLDIFLEAEGQAEKIKSTCTNLLLHCVKSVGTTPGTGM